MREDLRVVKTEENIRNQFIRLLDTKLFKDITISDILAACRINRSTFYRHYTDKYDLAEQIINDQLEQFKETLRPDFINADHLSFSGAGTFLKPVISYFKENKDILNALYKGQPPVNIFDEMYSYMTDLLYEYAVKHFHVANNKMILNYYMRLISTNILTTFKWWQTEAPQLNDQEILNIIVHSVNEGIFTSMYKCIHEGH